MHATVLLILNNLRLLASKFIRWSSVKNYNDLFKKYISKFFQNEHKFITLKESYFFAYGVKCKYVQNNSNTHYGTLPLRYWFGSIIFLQERLLQKNLSFIMTFLIILECQMRISYPNYNGLKLMLQEKKREGKWKEKAEVFRLLKM